MNVKFTERDANQYSPLTLAFLGDSVYELLVRQRIVSMANLPAAKLHSLKIKRVCAAFQSRALDMIKDELSEKEAAVVRRGRNATGNTVPKNSTTADYRRATALEALFGYLKLIGDDERIEKLFDMIWDMEEFEIN